MKMNFQAAMTEAELILGEKRHKIIDESRKLTMATGLTRSSKQLENSCRMDLKAYIAILKGAVAAYEQNKLIEELLRGAIARLLVAVSTDGIDAQLVNNCIEIATSKISHHAHQDVTTS